MQDAPSHHCLFAEVETAGTFYNVQVSIPLVYIITKMGHPHPDTPLKTDNANASLFVHDKITQKKSKSWDMRFYWLQNKQQTQYFYIYSNSGHNKLTYYYTKHHTTQRHKDIRKTYVRDKLN